MKRIIGMALSTAIGIGLAAAPAQAITYKITSLATDGTTSVAYDINNAGQVTGYKLDASYKVHGVLWTNGVASALDASGYDESSGWALNERGQIIGHGFRNTPEGQQATPLLWTNGAPVALPLLDGKPAGVNAINESGTAVGRAHLAPGEGRAVIWDNGAVRDLGTLGGSFGTAEDINDRGQVVGFSQRADGSYGATLWDTDGSIKDLGGRFDSAISAINNHGTALVSTEAGWADRRHALVTDGQATELAQLAGELFSSVHDLNDAGLVVGNTTMPASAYSIATLWQDGQAYDLFQLVAGDRAGFATLVDAYGINDAGQIVGVGITSAGSWQAFALTPVPEPGQWLLLPLGGLVLLGRRALRRSAA